MSNLSCIFCDIIMDQQNSTLVANLDSSVILLNYDQENYPGRVLVIFKKHETDILMLSRKARYELIDDVMFVAEVIKGLYDADHMNYCNLGNEVNHLHWHVIPRYQGDINWGRPPWPVPTPEKLPNEAYRKIADSIRQVIHESTGCDRSLPRCLCC